MATQKHKEKAETRASAGLRPDQCVKVRVRVKASSYSRPYWFGYTSFLPKATAPDRAVPDPAKSKPPKPVRFWGSSLKDLRSFPPGVRQDCGYQIDKVQRGEQPDSFKPLAIVGKGVEEIIVNDDDGWFRVMYAARLEDAVHVLHAFQKKTNQTSPRDIEVGQKRYKELVESRQRKATK